jgi:hypothetical protein
MRRARIIAITWRQWGALFDMKLVLIQRQKVLILAPIKAGRGTLSVTVRALHFSAHSKNLTEVSCCRVILENEAEGFRRRYYPGGFAGYSCANDLSVSRQLDTGIVVDQSSPLGLTDCPLRFLLVLVQWVFISPPAEYIHCLKA